MRENRSYGSEGGEGQPFPTPIRHGHPRPAGGSVRGVRGTRFMVNTLAAAIRVNIVI
jgi:hypothetical protein